MATYELTATQLIAFLEFTWNRHLPEWHKHLFASILVYEESRTFSEGQGYCESRLEISIVATKSYHYEWNYTTSGGTKITALMSDDGDEVFSVTIPDHRDQPGRTAHTNMQAVLACHSYWTWEEWQDESNSDALAAAAFFQGVTVEELLATRKKEEEEEEEDEEEEQRKRHKYELNPEDGSYEEVEEDAYG